MEEIRGRLNKARDELTETDADLAELETKRAAVAGKLDALRDSVVRPLAPADGRGRVDCKRAALAARR
jgi:hypothetical protein